MKNSLLSPVLQNGKKVFWEHDKRNNSHQDENVVIIFLAHACAWLAGWLAEVLRHIMFLGLHSVL